jgi:hypothetical protein
MHPVTIRQKNLFKKILNEEDRPILTLYGDGFTLVPGDLPSILPFSIFFPSEINEDEYYY